MVDFGQILKELRQKAGLTQSQLAAKVNLTKSQISHYELQERAPSPEILIKLALNLHVTTDYLLGIEQNPTHTLDISDLTFEQIELIEHTISVLRKANEK